MLFIFTYHLFFTFQWTVYHGQFTVVRLETAIRSWPAKPPLRYILGHIQESDHISAQTVKRHSHRVTIYTGTSGHSELVETCMAIFLRILELKEEQEIAPCDIWSCSDMSIFRLKSFISSSILFFPLRPRRDNYELSMYLLNILFVKALVYTYRHCATTTDVKS